ncbi:MAG: luciferase family protein [Pseudomonadota bacterium]
MHKTLTLDSRTGPLPQTTKRLPHSQLTQHGPDDIVNKLHQWAFSLPQVENQQSGISVPGARALVMHDSCNCNPEAFMIGREFAHIHPHPDNGSMHVMLPAEDAAEIVAKGWGEDHYLVTAGQWAPGLVMVFSPRDDAELETIKCIVTRSYEFATNLSSGSANR